MMKKLSVVINISIIALSISLSTIALADDIITKESISALLETEAKYVRENNINGLLSLVSPDFQAVVDGKTMNKEEYKLHLFKNFMTTEASIEYPKLIDYSISENGKSADIVVDLTTKFLVQRGGVKEVFTDNVIQKSKIKLINGILQFTNGEEVKQ